MKMNPASRRDHLQPQVWEAYQLFYMKNQAYHASKERMLWLGAAAYAGVSVVVIGWLMHRSHLPHKGYLAGSLCGLGVFAFVFTWAQNWWKCQAAYVDRRMTRWLSRATGNSANVEDVCRIQQYPVSKFKEKAHDFIKDGIPGILVLLLILAFLAGQVAILSLK